MYIRTSKKQYELFMRNIKAYLQKAPNKKFMLASPKNENSYMCSYIAIEFESTYPQISKYKLYT